MDAEDLALRNLTYRLFVDRGRAPTVAEAAAAAGTSTDAVRRGWAGLHRQHALVLDAATSELRMANPFSAVPTPFPVVAGGRQYYGNCIWDALGIPAMLRTDAVIDTSCADCGTAARVEVRSGAVRGDGIIHFAIRAHDWWKDIVFN